MIEKFIRGKYELGGHVYQHFDGILRVAREAGYNGSLSVLYCRYMAGEHDLARLFAPCNEAKREKAIQASKRKKDEMATLCANMPRRRW